MRLFVSFTQQWWIHYGRSDDLCYDHCHKNEATIHMTNIVNNQKTEQHLCGTCATELQQGANYLL